MTKSLKLEIVSQMLTLASSAFGLVAALAWNTAIQTLINDFIKPLLPKGGSAILSQLIYALIVTVLAVIFTFKLSQIKEKLEA